MCIIELQQGSDKVAVEDLLDLTFGKDRFDKAAYSLREGVEAIDDLSFVVRRDGDVIATLRFWPVVIEDADALLLGPIAVLPELQGQGYGINLMKHGLSKAKELGHSRVILVGDEPYYKKIGFSREMALSLSMEGQADESRLLACALSQGAFDGVKGLISKPSEQ